MKVDIDLMYGCVIGMLLILVVILFKETKTLQTQIDELKIIVDQKFLPAMILEEPTIRNYDY
jgi:hypothetical protein